MKKHIALATLTVASLMMTAGLVSAATISTPTYSPGTTWNVYKVEAWWTTGYTMDGIEVKATFSNQTSETDAWTGGSGASGSGWSLTMLVANGYNGYSENTWWDSTYWILSNTSGQTLTSLEINGKPGNTVFDVILEDSTATDFHTPGSFDGRTPVTDGNSALGVNVDVMYSNRVTLNGQFYDDLYQTVTFNFSGGLASGQSFWFALDTDNVNPVPEPATMLLFGIGAMGIAAIRKRKTV